MRFFFVPYLKPAAGWSAELVLQCSPLHRCNFLKFYITFITISDSLNTYLSVLQCREVKVYSVLDHDELAE